ncbi:PREDICTED: RNA polymerase II elongation factor Ell isoform X2 [Eufriesea mexicana]|uniref:RNA polymerase II elongation factor Ell isoform X2 n=1 Tax=Eufriesea mexicana TaxID=516756 RepID=UPI00083C0A11|nr:PREDICTED: RNA polymerase II elongation factor Ell isoform X2 [Eufriesea mexicana]
MAALVAGVQYGLSSHSNFHENKSLIFVKLTDSAQRAIEDFLRNRNKTSQNPTIQFLGNEGQLSFPSTQSNHGSAGFTFSLSGNQDIEGPQGGFECIQQTGPKSLESLGALPCKMRIQANDDVYETTRHRMAVAEENNKNKCTRVIKANGPDIGRKVKVKATGRTIPSPSNSRHRESTSIPTSGSQPRLSSSYKSVTNNLPPARNQPEKKVSDIMRRPLKERLIHLLALRPYKKPELYDRINQGIKDRERNVMTTILKQVAFMRDNTYHLHRYVWNDVQEDWPYYTEQEKAMLKRRKPQNLTPPGSSDGGSSGSGQSPNSTHPGSPPAITAPPPSLLSNKRPGYYQGNDGLPTKRPRISHYKKPEPNSGSSNAGENGRTAGSGGSSNSVSVVSGGAGGSSANGGSGGSSGGVVDSWDQRQHQRDRRGDYRPERTTNSDVLRGGSYGTGKPCLTPTSDSEETNQPGHRDGIIANTGTSGNNATSNVTTGHNSHNSVAHSNSLSASRHHHAGKSATLGADGNAVPAVDYVGRSMPSAVSDGGSAGSYSGSSNGILADRRDRSDRNDRGRAGDRDRDSRKKSNGTGSNSYNDLSAPDYAANGDNTVTTSSCGLDLPESPKSSEYPDYLTYYTTISSAEQRRRYKAEFNADYEEYRRLHAQVAEVSRHFTQLQDRLRQEEASANWDEYEEIRRQILQEYDETKRDPVHTETKRRFHYLHEKLSHIKRLVLEYDTQNCGGNIMTSSSNADGSNEIKEMGSLHY